jgi:hypothetical protein
MPGLIRGVARTAVVAGTATAVSNRVSRRQAGRWAVQQEGDAPEYAPPPSSPVSSRLDELKQLGELKAQGVLSDAEFEAEKARILAR